MALLFLDGFDHVGTGNTYLLKKWDAGANVNVVTTPVQTGAGAMDLQAGGIDKFVTAADSSVLGFGFRRTVNWNDFEFLLCRESGTVHLDWAVNTAGFLVVRRGMSTVVATATSGAMALDTWYYLELKFRIHETLGSFAARVDGVPVTWSAAVTNIDTQDGGTGVVNRFNFYNSIGGHLYFDNLYLCDTTGATSNDFLGICSVETLLPQTGNGDHVDFTPSTGTDHGALVDETPPTDDTDYVSSTTVDHQDSYHYPSLALTGTVLGVQTNLYLRKTDAGARTVAPLVRTGGTTTTVGTAISPTTTYLYYTAARDLNPATGPRGPRRTSRPCRRA